MVGLQVQVKNRQQNNQVTCVQFIYAKMQKSRACWSAVATSTEQNVYIIQPSVSPSYENEQFP